MNSFFYNFFHNSFDNLFVFIYIKMSQLNNINKIKKNYKGKLVKDVKIFLKKKKKKKHQYGGERYKNLSENEKIN